MKLSTKKLASVLLYAFVVLNVWGYVESTPTNDFAGAQWIAAEADSTILFPHIHLLKENSPEAKSLKQYTLPTLRKTIRLSDKVKRAWVDVCGLGQYELWIDSKKVGDKFMSPGWTMYDKELLYNEFDVTDLLRRKKGKEVELKVMLGGGMYDIPVHGYHKMAGSCGAPKLLLSLHVEYKDGSVEDFVTDSSWSAEDSPVRFSSIYAGEWHDAGVKSERRPVVLTRPYFDVPLVKQSAGTMVKVSQELPIKKIAPKLYDMGQNCSGIVRVKVKGGKGQSIRLRPAEILKDGAVYQRCMPDYEWKYTLAGDKHGEEWQPQFTYTGFRYVEVDCDEGVELLELTGLHTTTDTPETGRFECSDTLLNKIHSLIDWAIRSNMASITTDCPTREKLGWQEQNHLMAHSIMYRYDVRELMNKIAGDLADSQHSSGAIPTIAPEYTAFTPGSGFEDTPEWGASFILCPWYTYLWYGDDSAIRKHYTAMKRYMSYLGERADDGIIEYGLGDWFDIGPARPGKAQLTSVALSATAIYHYELNTMAKIAAMLGKDEDKAEFESLAREVKEAFNKKFQSGDDRVYENGSQTGLAMAIYMDLVPDSLKQKAVDALVRDIQDRNYALTAGDVGYRYVVQALQQNDRSDVIYKMNHNDSIPSYAYQLKKGATALTESWQAYDNVSNNHLMLGHLMEWLYGGLGGITYDAALADGNYWRHIIINPQMVGDVTWANTSLDTPEGLVECRWQKSADGNSWRVEVTIPDNSDAKIYLPDGRVEKANSGRYVYGNR